jgi:dUTP pyrophosphatase
MEIKLFCENEKLIPKYNHKTDAAFDLRASGNLMLDLDENKREVVFEKYELKPNERVLVKTGIKLSLPKQCYGSIRDRSGLAIKGITTLGGVIDNEYTGEIGVILLNVSKKPFVIEKYDRIAQMIIQKYESCEFTQTNNLEKTLRGEKGFGSSGQK